MGKAIVEIDLFTDFRIAVKRNRYALVVLARRPKFVKTSKALHRSMSVKEYSVCKVEGLDFLRRLVGDKYICKRFGNEIDMTSVVSDKDIAGIEENVIKGFNRALRNIKRVKAEIYSSGLIFKKYTLRFTEK